MPKHDNFLLNKNMNFPYSLSFDPVSSPSNHLLKIIFFTSFFISDSTVLRKMDHFDISFVIWKLYRSRELTKPTLLDPDHFPCSPKRQWCWLLQCIVMAALTKGLPSACILLEKIQNTNTFMGGLKEKLPDNKTPLSIVSSSWLQVRAQVFLFCVSFSSLTFARL